MVIFKKRSLLVYRACQTFPPSACGYSTDGLPQSETIHVRITRRRASLAFRRTIEMRLGACIGVYVTQYCKQVGLDCDNATVEMIWETAKGPARVGQLRARINVPAGIPDERRAGVKRAAERCLIHATLRSKPAIDIELA